MLYHRNAYDFNGHIKGGAVGIIFDGRGREINFSEEKNERINQILDWSNSSNEYPKGNK